MSEILSQEQIDSLLNQRELTGQLSSDAESGELSEGMRKKDYHLLQKAFELFCEKAGEVVTTILNKKVHFKTVSSAQTDESQARRSVGGPLLCLTISFAADVEGSLYCIFAKKDAARLADLMMMGDGSAPYSDDHKDAIVELFNQILGSYSTALSTQIHPQVRVQVVAASEFDFSAPPIQFGKSDSVYLQGSIDGGSEWSMLFLIPDGMSVNMMQMMGGGSEQGMISGSSGELQDGSIAGGLSDGGAPSDSFIETSLTGDSVRTSSSHENIEMLLDVDLDVSIELGRTNLSIKRILELSPGSIVELDRMAGEPVDLLVNDKVVAKGEVVVIDENFGIRIVSLISAEERIKSLK